MQEPILPTNDPSVRDASRTMSLTEANRVVSEAHRTFLQWRTTSFTDRSSRMNQLARLLREQKARLAQLITEEMGKPITQSEAEIDKCAWVCEYYAEHAERQLAPEPHPSTGQRSYVTYRPLGVVLAIMPWNFPFWQVFRFAVPALMAGNGAVLKHASLVPRCAAAIEMLFTAASFPKGLFSVVYLRSQEVESIIERGEIAAVTLTGSPRAGRKVASAAGRCLKKTVLELGGSDPYVVLSDADLALAAEVCVKSRLINGGQSCIAAKRFIVHEDCHDEFLQRILSQLSRIQMGDPRERGTELGPMASKELRDDLHAQVQRSIELGATLELGGVIPERPGAFYPPTCLTNVRPGMPAYEEELFGPVCAVLRARDDEHAMMLANDTQYGLGGAIFSRNAGWAEELAAKVLEAGLCFVNSQVQSDPRLPFGGIKASGYGRELSELGIREFVNVKAVRVA